MYMRRILVTLLLLVAPLLPAAPVAHAETQSSPVGVANCANSANALCDPVVNVPVQTGGVLQVIFVLSDVSCSSKITCSWIARR